MLDAWVVYYISILGLRYTDTDIYVRETYDWSRLYPELRYDREAREIRIPRSLVQGPRFDTPFGHGWYMKGKRIIMFLGADPIHHGYRLYFATRGEKVSKRLAGCDMTQIWVDPNAKRR